MSKDQKRALDRLFGYVSTHKNISYTTIHCTRINLGYTAIQLYIYIAIYLRKYIAAYRYIVINLHSYTAV